VVIEIQLQFVNFKIIKLPSELGTGNWRHALRLKKDNGRKEVFKPVRDKCK